MKDKINTHVAIIGAGFCGLAAAYELAKNDIQVTVVEQDPSIGGLAGSFDVNGVEIEKFYHHWFTNDEHVMRIIKELGKSDQVLLRPTKTGMYYTNNFFKLSTPLDLLRFKPLSFINRIRLGLLTLRARKVKNWRSLENHTASDWLRRMGGDKVYNIVWEPLLKGKFGDLTEEISAVWFWNKIKLRGGSRGKDGKEQLAYYRGGFAALAQTMAEYISSKGGEIIVGATVTKLRACGGHITGIETDSKQISADTVIATLPLPVFADLVEEHVSEHYISKLRRIRFLANICIVLELNQSLSDTYWLNVNDPGFPFIGVIEHTNFEPPESYGGHHIVYLSKYLAESHPLFQMPDNDVIKYTLEHLKLMFPELDADWILNAHVWRANYSQPVVEKNFSALIPPKETPLKGLYLATMAQIYPEDRGTNYAIREGTSIAQLAIKERIS